MKLGLLSLSIIYIFPIAAKSTAQAQPSIQCPSLPPDGHVSQFYCKMADGSLIHVDGLGSFDCESSYIAIRPQMNKDGAEWESEKSPSKESTYCEVRLIQFTNDGNVHHGCCKDGVALFESQTPSLQPLDPTDGMQKPVQQLHADPRVTDRKLQKQDEKELENEGEGDKGDYEEEDEEEDDYDYDSHEADDEDDEEGEDEEEGEDNEDDEYSDYGYDQDVDEEVVT